MKLRVSEPLTEATILWSYFIFILFFKIILSKSSGIFFLYMMNLITEEFGDINILCICFREYLFLFGLYIFMALLVLFLLLSSSLSILLCLSRIFYSVIYFAVISIFV